MNISKKYKQRSGWISLEMLNTFLRPLSLSLISLMVIRLSDVSSWGVIVPILVTLELAMSIVNWGQKPHLVREFSMAPSTISGSWYESVLSRIPLLIIALLLAAFLPWIDGYRWEYMTLLVLRALLSFFDPLIQFHRKYWASIIGEFLGFLGVILALWFTRDFSLGFLLSCLILASALKLLSLLSLLPKPELPKKFSIARSLVLALPFFSLSIAGLIQSKGDLYVVTSLLDASSIAFYQIMIGFLIIAQTLSGLMLNPFHKNLYRMKGKDISKIKGLHLRIGWITSLMLAVGIYVVLKWVYQLPTPVEYILLMVLYQIPLYYYLVDSQVMLRKGQEKKLLHHTLISGGVNLLISLILVPLLGIVGALTSGIICRIVIATLVVRFAAKIKGEE